MTPDYYQDCVYQMFHCNILGAGKGNFKTMKVSTAALRLRAMRKRIDITKALIVFLRVCQVQLCVRRRYCRDHHTKTGLQHLLDRWSDDGGVGLDNEDDDEDQDEETVFIETVCPLFRYVIEHLVDAPSLKRKIKRRKRKRN